MKYFVFGERTVARVCPCLDRELLARLWKGFCFTLGELELDPSGEKKKIVIGKETELALGDGEEYAVSVTEEGITVLGRDKRTLMRGFMALIARIEAEDLTKKREFRIGCCEIRGEFSINVRMAHLCVFPETELSELQKRIRLFGALQYTHIIIEFWGMIKLDCLEELAWRDKAFEKSQIEPLIREAREMGMEPVPMFNHLGHATAARIFNGKHVVLDQNPALQHLFTPDGWAWNFELPEVRALLRSIRAELYELFGEGEYVHLGFDESFIHSAGYAPKSHVSAYMAATIKEAEDEGRRAIIWGDMLLCAEEVGCADGKYKYNCTEKNPEDAKLMRSMLPKSVLIADWHYDIPEAPIVTSVFLKNEGFDVIGCPWYDKQNIAAHLETAKKEKLFGAMLTTWHTFGNYPRTAGIFAAGCGTPLPDWWRFAYPNTAVSTMLRKLMPLPSCYEECGNLRYQEITETIR